MAVITGNPLDVVEPGMEKHRDQVRYLVDLFGIEPRIAGARESRKDAHSTIWGPVIRTEYDYWSWLHELGHVANDHQNTRHPTLERLEAEGEAWEWALDNAIEPPSPKQWFRIGEALVSYLGDRSLQGTGGPTFHWLTGQVLDGMG